LVHPWLDGFGPTKKSDLSKLRRPHPLAATRPPLQLCARPPGANPGVGVRFLAVGFVLFFLGWFHSKGENSICRVEASSSLGRKGGAKSLSGHRF